MTLLNIVTDVKFWVLIGLILGLTVGFDHPDAGTILMIVLIIQMTLSLDGLAFRKEDFKDDAKGILVALGLTPMITHLLIGSAVSPLEVLRYILMFILIPFILTIPLKRLHLPRIPKVIGINLMMMFMIFIGLGSRREYIFDEPQVVMWIIVGCLLRIFAFSIVFTLLLKRMNVERGAAITYISMGFWKNSGMATSMCMALLVAVYPSSVLPCIISLVTEAAWFAILNALVKKIWPAPVEDLLATTN